MPISKHFLVIILVFAVNSLFSQSIEGVVFSNDGSSVSYASIYLKNKKTGIITDSLGHYKLPDNILQELEDTLVFSCLGYKSEKISVLSFKEKVLRQQTDISLMPNSILLNDVNIYPTANKNFEYGLFKLKTCNVFLHGKHLSRLLVFIENTDGVHRIIKFVNIKLLNNNDKTKKLRLFFAKKVGDDFQVLDVSQEDIIISDFSKSNAKIDVSKYNIPFPQDGICVGLEWIGTENEVQALSNKTGLSVDCTAKFGKRCTWFFQNDEWKEISTRLTEENEEALKKVPENFRKVFKNANARIGITAY
jgi:hypothetical protein